jgi:F-type H+-transporting ATPase subunit epsilon
MVLPKEINLILVTPMAVEFHGAATSVVAPGTEGYLGVLPGHIPFVTALKPGMVKVTAEGRQRVFEIGAGYMEVTPAWVIIVTEEATSKGGDG